MEKSEQEASGNYAYSMRCLENAKLADSLFRADPPMTSTPALRLSHFVATHLIRSSVGPYQYTEVDYGWQRRGDACKFEVVLKNRHIRTYDKNANRACS